MHAGSIGHVIRSLKQLGIRKLTENCSRRNTQFGRKQPLCIGFVLMLSLRAVLTSVYKAKLGQRNHTIFLFHRAR